MAHDAFISYSSKDKPIADGICANLESTGIRCWIAPRDIHPGEDWPKAITEAISNSKVMVLVFSASSNSSEDVSREIILAATSKLVIIPFKIEDIEPEPGKKYYLARTHWLEAMNPPTLEQIQSLVETVRALVPAVGAEGYVKPAFIPIPPKKQTFITKKSQSRWRYLWLAGSLVLFALGFTFWPKIQGMLASPTPTPTLTAMYSLQPTRTTLAATTIVITPTPAVNFILQKTLQGQSGAANSVAFSPDGSLLASGAQDASVTLWDIASGEKKDTLWGHTGFISSVAFSPDGNILASASGDGTIKFWWFQLVNQQDTLRSEDTGGTFCMIFSADGSTIASGYNRAKVILWDVSTGRELRTLHDHKFFLESVAFSPDGRMLASSGSSENSIILNETASGNLLQTLHGNHGDFTMTVFFPDGSSLLGLSVDGTVTLWDTSTWEEERSYTAGKIIALSPDGQLLATGNPGESSISLMEASDGTWLQTIQGDMAGIRSLAFSSDGLRLAAGFNDGTVKIWNLGE